MDISIHYGEDRHTLLPKSTLFAASILLVPILIFLVSYLGLYDAKFLLIIAVPLILLALLSFEVMLFFLSFTLYLHIFPADLHVGIFFVYFLLLSYLLTYGKFNISGMPLNIPIAVYFLCIIPSLSNSVSIVSTIYYSQNLFVIFLTAYILYNYIDNFDKIKKILYFVVVFSLANAFYIIIAGGATGKRFWGFAGIEHVDYLSIIALSFLLTSIISKGSKKVLPALILSIFIVAMVITQTRNIFISLGVTFGLAIFYLLKNNKKYRLKRQNLVIAIVCIIIIPAFIIMSTNLLESKSFERFSQLEKMETQQIQKEEDFGTNSFFSRLLIWHTTYKAFIAHPIVGIGAASFPFSSQYYEELPPNLYKTFVKGLSPHVAYFAVLAETGIVGFAGFIFLLISLLRLSYKNLRKAQSSEAIIYTTIISFAQIYIIIAMFVTDAWLRGQCGLLWGIILGCLTGITKLLSSKKEYLLPAKL